MLPVSQYCQIQLQKLDIPIPFFPEIALDYLWIQIPGIETSWVEILYLEKEIADS